MRLSIPLVFLISISNGFAQINSAIINWEKTYGGSDYELIRSIQLLGDGGYLLCGSSGSDDGDIQSGNNGNLDFWIVKTDKDGGVSWEQTYGGSQSEYLKFVVPTLGGGFLVGGATRSNDGDVNSGNNGDLDFWVVKIDPAGKIEWEQTYGGSNTDVLQSIISLPDNGYLLAGSTRSSNGDVQSGNAGNSDFWLIRINNVGELVWEKTYGEQNSETLTSLQATPDGGYILGGFKFSVSQYGIIQSDYWVVKIDSLGNVEWQHSYGGSYDDSIKIIQPADNGEFLLAGITSSSDGDLLSGNNGDFPTLDIWVVRINKNGDMLWEQTFGGTGNDILNTISPVEGGGYLLGGTTDSRDKDIQSGNKGNFDTWIVKISEFGTLEWEKTLGGSKSEVIRYIRPKPDGNYLLGGSTMSDDGDIQSGNNGFNEFWLVEVNISDSSTIDDNLILGIEEVNNTVKVYPNPIENTVLNIDIGASGNFVLEVVDVTNQLVFSKNILTGPNHIYWDMIATGVYYLRIYNITEVIHQQRIIRK